LLPATSNQQPTTNNQQPTTNNQQPTTNNQQPTLIALAIIAAIATQCADCPPELPAVVAQARMPADDVRKPERSARVDLADLARRRAATDLSEPLSELPGVIARQRHNEAQDTQTQIRGFGARSPFGVRGLRIEYDGIPATAADGQSQIGHIDLSAGGQLTLIRGPFAALYGNGGGYLRIDGDRNLQRAGDRVMLATGDNGQRRVGFDSQHGDEIWRVGVAAHRYRTDGVRKRSAAERTLASTRLDWAPSAAGLWSLTAHHQEQPDSQDPQGLTRAEFDVDPFSASPAAQAFQTRKSTRQTQFGARYEHTWGAAEFSIAAYAGQRSIEQFLSVPRVAQLQRSSGGGVVALDRDYWGAALRWRQRSSWSWADAELGAEWRDERLREDRRGYENFVGDQLGVRGALRRDETNRGDNRDAMVRIDIDPDAAWRLSGGVRRSNADFASNDYYIAPGNPDDSGGYRSNAWLPVVGASYRFDSAWTVHAALGRTQELPTLAELAYRQDGDGGFNDALNPARGTQAEMGCNYAGDRLAAEWTMFRIEVDDEIVVASSQGGRSSFQNGGATRRHGLEMAIDWHWSSQWRLRGVANWLDARYTEGYSACAQAPCTLPGDTIEAGRRLPGVAPRAGRMELVWARDGELDAALEWLGMAATPASDRNHDQVPGYAVVSARVSARFAPQSWGRLSALARVDNLFDRRYSGSLIVNEAARRYFETAPGRGFWLGLELALP
jgi:iron complex outermembrane receptor protein